jgi:hypothetical protein
MRAAVPKAGQIERAAQPACSREGACSVRNNLKVMP